ncbi:MAG: DUF998 domain-containing protein [Phycisphaerales bacterium]|nr:DUF998 domain-containing protein [Phycisphaerales bacterium]
MADSTRGGAGVMTRRLLYCGVAAGPVYVGVGALQMLLREGFDPTRHALSLMSLGDLGFIQISNFIVSGVLVLLGAVGMRRAMVGGRGRLAGPVLLGVYGLGLIASGVFVADAMDGFPPGTPPGPPEAMSWHGQLHFLCGAVGFLGAIGACFAMALRFKAQRLTGWGVYSAATGVLFLAGFFAIASGGGAAWSILAFTGAVVLLWVWISAVSWKLAASTGADAAETADAGGER